MPITFKQTISWHNRDGSLTEYSNESTDPNKDLLPELLRKAKEHWGWTRPRWWQYWRWHDTDYDRFLKERSEKMNARIYVLDNARISDTAIQRRI